MKDNCPCWTGSDKGEKPADSNGVFAYVVCVRSAGKNSLMAHDDALMQPSYHSTTNHRGNVSNKEVISTVTIIWCLMVVHNHIKVIMPLPCPTDMLNV